MVLKCPVHVALSHVMFYIRMSEVSFLWSSDTIILYLNVTVLTYIIYMGIIIGEPVFWVSVN